MGRHKHREWGIAESQFYVANILFIQPINLQIDPNIQMGTRITLVCPGKCFKEKKKTNFRFWDWITDDKKKKTVGRDK